MTARKKKIWEIQFESWNSHRNFECNQIDRLRNRKRMIHLLDKAHCGSIHAKYLTIVETVKCQCSMYHQYYAPLCNLYVKKKKISMESDSGGYLKSLRLIQSHKLTIMPRHINSVYISEPIHVAIKSSDELKCLKSGEEWICNVCGFCGAKHSIVWITKWVFSVEMEVGLAWDYLVHYKF